LDEWRDVAEGDCRHLDDLAHPMQWLLSAVGNRLNDPVWFPVVRRADREEARIDLKGYTRTAATEILPKVEILTMGRKASNVAIVVFGERRFIEQPKPPKKIR